MASEAYHSSEYYKQQRKMLLNGDPRAPICFCIDVSKSMSEWWIQPGGLARTTGSGFDDGHNVNYFDPKDIRRGYDHYIKIDRLNEVLTNLLKEFKQDPNLSSKVAVSIVTYSRYGKVDYDFLDCADLDLKACTCKVDYPETAMGDGLRTALSQIDEMAQDLRHVGKDTYTPLLVFMTDGTPTDDPRKEFTEVRRRVQDGELHIFPLGIGDEADMVRLRDMFPVGQVPDGFSTKYKMVRTQDYAEIFRQIKAHMVQRQSVMVSEGDSIQSAPAIIDEAVINNQMGETTEFEELISYSSFI
jgi:uncharacterized protein YegL